MGSFMLVTKRGVAQGMPIHGFRGAMCRDDELAGTGSGENARADATMTAENMDGAASGREIHPTRTNRYCISKHLLLY